ncbi:MAG TPA: hypothetical protein VK466_01920, partial [Terriglobales bacterium]|nr:hypothetical protein [Terriglobales bacterium]
LMPGGDYYLAGGRSNRDYVSLVEAFRSLPARLLIVCSQGNREELEGIALPDNVAVECDVPSEVFDQHVRGAKAGIIPLQHDTGSAGQSVGLALMRNAKCILATRTGGLEDYIEDGVSGYWIDDLGRDVPALIRKLENDPGGAEKMGRASRQRYEARFSLTLAASAFENVLATTCAAADLWEPELRDSIPG